MEVICSFCIRGLVYACSYLRQCHVHFNNGLLLSSFVFIAQFKYTISDVLLYIVFVCFFSITRCRSLPVFVLYCLQCDIFCNINYLNVSFKRSVSASESDT